MKKSLKIFASACVVLAVFVIGVQFAFAGNVDEGSLTPMNPFLKRGYAQLGLSDAQITAMKAIIKKNLPDLQTMTNQAISEQRALKVLMRAEPVSEAAIRAQAAKVASLRADLSVKWAFIGQEIRHGVLTPDQLKKAEQLRLYKQKRFDRYMARTFMWYAE